MEWFSSGRGIRNALLLFAGLVLGGQKPLPLDRGWVMKTGDQPEWAMPDFDDGSWAAVQVGRPWEEAGFPEYDGYAWYRITFRVPQGWKQEARHGFLSLSLGWIDDSDITYFNGRQIGATGAVPPDYQTAYDTTRRYRVPVSLVRWGQENVIAVRVYDGQGPGGIYRGSFLLKLPDLSDLVGLTFHPGNSNGIFSFPGPLSVKVILENFSPKPFLHEAVFSLMNDRVDSARVLGSIRRTLHLGGHGQTSEIIPFTPPQPGFYRVVCRLEGEILKSMVFGYDPERITAPLNRRLDFEMFWMKRKSELALVDPEFRVLPDGRSTDKVSVYLVEMKSYGGVTVRGWYTVPSGPGPHPAILSLPGYTSAMQPSLDRMNVATFALNPRGHGNSRDDVDPRGGEFMFLGFDAGHPENYVYAGVFMDCIRAVDFLVSRREIDASRIGVEGGSQGGGLAFATAALDPRMVFCAPDIPWMGDWKGYLEAAPWGMENYPKLIRANPGLTLEGINRLLSYFDTMNMAEWITCPVLMSVGLQDDVCPPRTAFTTYHAVKSLKEYHVYPFAGHRVEPVHQKLKDRWMAGMLGIDALGAD